MEQKEALKQRWLAAGKKKKILAAIVIFGVVLIAARGLYMKHTARTQRQVEIKPAVEVLTAQRGDLYRKIELSGQTVAESQVDIAAKYTGIIVKVDAELGQQVIPGQILIVQDTSDVDISLRQYGASHRQAIADAIESNASFEASYHKAQADYNLSVINYERYKKLYEIGAVSKQALDNTEQQMIAYKAAVDTWTKQMVSGQAASVMSKQAARDKAQSAVDALQNQRNDLILRAPCVGTIGFRQAEAGNLAQAGQKLLSVIDASSIYVDCPVSEQDIGHIAIAMPTNIFIESLGKSYSGKITYISPAIDPKTQSFTIRIALDKTDGAIRIGMFARTEISVLLRPQVLVVPLAAIVSLNGTDRLFVVDSNNIVAEKIVKLGLRNDRSVEILSGLNPGEVVAVSNLARLKTGMAIQAKAAD